MRFTVFEEFTNNALTQFREVYEESGITKLFEDYLKWLVISVAISFAFTSISYVLVNLLFLHLNLLRLLLAAFSLSLIVSGLVSFALLYYPLYRRNQMRGEIENEIIYTLSYMTVLSSSGISLERIIERVADVEENPYIKQLATKFMMNIRLFGFDVTSAIKDVSNRSPSGIMKKLLDSMNNAVQTSGDLKNTLTYEVERQLQRKRDVLRGMMGTLTYLGELYVTFMVVAPILFILMFTILSVLNRGASGGSSVLQLNLIVFFGIPVIAAAFMIILDTALVGEE